MELSKDGYFLKPEGHAFEFESEAAARGLKSWLDSKGCEVGYVDVFCDHMRDIWVVTQYMAVLTQISENEEAFAQYTESISAISEANRKSA